MNFHPHLNFAISDADVKEKVHTLFIQEMAKRGCHGYTSFYLNAAQGEAEIEQTADAASETFTIIGSGIESEQIDSLLECEIRTDSFRRLVR